MTVPRFLQLPADRAAPHLLGWRIVSEVDGLLTSVGLTEVEAYRSDDPASHSFGGPRGRNVVMFERPGLLYVYRSYGIHWCANVVCGRRNEGSAILLRAGLAVKGETSMAGRRGRGDNLTIGPGNLCQALGISGIHNGIDLFDRQSAIRLEKGPPPKAITTTARIGISKAKDRPWRFVASEG